MLTRSRSSRYASPPRQGGPSQCAPCYGRTWDGASFRERRVGSRSGISLASGCRSTGAACSLRERLGAAARVRMTGSTLAAMDHVLRAVLKHLGTQLQGLAPEIATLRALYRVERTLYAHQSWACAYAG